MNVITKPRVEKDLPALKATLKNNVENGRLDLLRRNTLNGLKKASEVLISSLRDGDYEPFILDLVKEWRTMLLDLEPFEFNDYNSFGEVVGDMGHLLNFKPEQKELKFIQDTWDKISTPACLSWNLYTGQKPDANLNDPDKRLQKYLDLLFELLQNPSHKAMKAFDQQYTKREKSSSWPSWHGGGPINPFFLDPLALSILKHIKADFDSDSIHMKGYRELVAAGF